MKWINRFLKDLNDKGAAPNSTAFNIKDFWSFLVVILSGLTGFLNDFNDLLIENLGLPASLLQVALLIISISGCVYIISAKSDKIATNVNINPTMNKEYSYAQKLRLLAKFLGIIVIILLPVRLIASIKEIMPLPNTLYGYIYDSKTNNPIVDARVRIRNNEGADITDGNWFTDNTGFYIVKASEKPKRDYKIIIIAEQCEDEVLLPMSASYERYDKLKDISYFKHTIKICKSE